MKVDVSQISEVPKEIRILEGIEDLNRIYPEGGSRDFRFPPFLDVKLVYYRSGREVFFQGWFEGTVEGTCSRCLKGYSFPIAKSFDFVLTPEPLPAKSKKLSHEELCLRFYSGEEINLSPFIQEEVLLVLPMRPLCDEHCRGLCAGCGVNLNIERCLCGSQPGDPRMAFFRNFRFGR
ncbi:MAG: DUF177 domain-containing protein [Candidatus Binatia bacterium]